MIIEFGWSPTIDFQGSKYKILSIQMGATNYPCTVVTLTKNNFLQSWQTIYSSASAGSIYNNHLQRLISTTKAISKTLFPINSYTRRKRIYEKIYFLRLAGITKYIDKKMYRYLSRILNCFTQTEYANIFWGNPTALL